MTLNEIVMSLEIGLIYGLVALGIYLTFRVLDFPDMTCDGSFVVGAATTSALIKAGVNPWMSLVGALGAGGLAGLTTALLYTKFKITPLLSGIVVGFMLYSLNLRIMGGVPNVPLGDTQSLFSETPLVQLVMILAAVYAVVLGLLKTDFGLSLRALGQNQRLAQNSGVPLAFMTGVGLAGSNALIALGGALFSQHQGFADIGSGLGTVIVGLASVMMGEKVFACGTLGGQLFSCVAGSILYRLLISVALHSDALGLETSDLNLLAGLMIILMMWIPRRSPC